MEAFSRRDLISLGASSIGLFGAWNLGIVPTSSKSQTAMSPPQELLDPVLACLKRLQGHGWREVFCAHGIDIAEPNPATWMRKMIKVDRTIPGFEDFFVSLQNTESAIVPQNPDASLLYHALASPDVTHTPSGKRLTAFPTPDELDGLENLIFGYEPISVDDLRYLSAGPRKVGIGVFASEYRSGASSVSGTHAGLCFAGMGIARVGTKPSHYLPSERGFGQDPTLSDSEVNVLPCRFKAYIFVEVPSSEFASTVGPDLGFVNRQVYPQLSAFSKEGVVDKNQAFAIPIYKIFPGNHCILGLKLRMSFWSQHINDKIRRIHENSEPGDWSHFAHYDQAPFTLRDADLVEPFNLTDPAFSHYDVIPKAKPRLVQEARYKGKVTIGDRQTENPPVYFWVTDKNRANRTVGSPSTGNGGPGVPDYIHIRTKVDIGEDGQFHYTDLNDSSDLLDYTLGIKDKYRALNYVDYTAEGTVKVTVPTLEKFLPRVKAAYSVVSPPTFFPRIDPTRLKFALDKSSLLATTAFTVPVANVISSLLNVRSASELRYGPNPFAFGKSESLTSTDTTVSALIQIVGASSKEGRLFSSSDPLRQSCLPDAINGYFNPGVELGADEVPRHFAMYKTSSPFPEDIKLCAAIANSWTGTVPDVSNAYYPPTRSIPPTVVFLDNELGGTSVVFLK